MLLTPAFLYISSSRSQKRNQRERRQSKRPPPRARCGGPLESRREPLEVGEVGDFSRDEPGRPTGSRTSLDRKDAVTMLAAGAPVLRVRASAGDKLTLEGKRNGVLATVTAGYRVTLAAESADFVATIEGEPDAANGAAFGRGWRECAGCVRVGRARLCLAQRLCSFGPGLGRLPPRRGHLFCQRPHYTEIARILL